MEAVSSRQACRLRVGKGDYLGEDRHASFASDSVQRAYQGPAVGDQTQVRIQSEYACVECKHRGV